MASEEIILSHVKNDAFVAEILSLKSWTFPTHLEMCHALRVVKCSMDVDTPRSLILKLTVFYTVVSVATCDEVIVDQLIVNLLQCLSAKEF